jgi:hypothetical protein
MDRQRRAANPGNYDEKGRIRSTGGKRKLHWKASRSYEQTRRRKANQERKLAAHRRSLHGRLVHEIVAVGNTVIIEKLSYKAWQKQYGRSVGLRAPGMFIDMLRRTGAAHGRHPARSPYTHDQTQPVLSRLRQDAQKAALTALSPVPVWHRSGAARSVLGVSGRLSGYKTTRPLSCPVPEVLGECGGALCAEEARFTLLRVRSPTGVDGGKATSYLMGKPKGDSSMTEKRLDG